MSIRVLHIWNTAGVASILAKFMDREYSTKSWVITRQAADPWGLTVFGETLNMGTYRFVLNALRRIRKYDLIHIHATDKIVPWVKRLYPKKPVLLHYHGSQVRGRWPSRRKYWKRADFLLVSTSDLLDGAPKHAIWLPNPVDTDLFYARAKARRNNHAFHITHEADDLAQEAAKKYQLQLTIHDRVANPIPYTEMGDILSSYEFYMDFKRSYSPGARGKLVKILSKTALEALACECKVFRWDGKIISGLPKRHNPTSVISKLWEYYHKILE